MTPLLVLAAVLAGTAAFCPTEEPCLRKCCPPGQMIRRNRCTPGGPPLSPPPGHVVVHAKPPCEMYTLDKSEDHTIHSNGTVTYDDQLTEYCVEWNDRNDTFTYVCFPPEDDEVVQQETTLWYYSLGLWVSLPFLFATFIIYATFKKLGNLHGRCIVFHTSSMLLAYICLGVVQNKLMEVNPYCTILGYAIQFFFMATFFWLNVMCFDIYWAFSGLKNLTGSVKERERKKLIMYSIYAWGSPLLILLVTVAIDYSPAIPDSSIFKPRVGVDKCFFKERGATGIYFYMPMGLIIMSNIILFTITAYRICTLRRETVGVLKRGDSRKHDSTNDKERFSLYLKLFLVMGINWVMELLSFFAGGPEYIWWIPDFTNTLQGVFIFTIFVCKRRVRRLVWAKLKGCCGKQSISNGSVKSPHTASTRNTNSSSFSQNSIKMTAISNAPNANAVPPPYAASVP